MGEFLAAFLFEQHDIEAVHVDRDDADLWIRLPDGRLATVQVKATAGPMAEDDRRPRYHWTMSARRGREHADVDFYAFVALDKQLMVVLPRHELQGIHYRLPVDNLSLKAQTESIEELLG